MTKHNNKFTVMALIALALLLLTWFSLTYYPRYIPISSELIQNASFSEDMQMWLLEGEESLIERYNNSVSMKVLNKRDNQRISQSFEDLPSGHYRIRADLKFTDIIQGEEAWQNAGIIVATYDKDTIRKSSHDIFTSSGSFNWHPIETVINLESAVETRLIVRMLNSPGEIAVRNISLQKVMQSEYYDNLRWGLITLWLVFAFFVVVSIIQGSSSAITLILLFSALLLTFLGTLIPKYWVIELSSMLANSLPSTWISSIENIAQNQLKIPLLSQNSIFSKAGHFLIFFILTIITLINFSRHSILTMFIILLYIALLSETLQLLTQARSASMIDIGIDTAGIVFGFIIIWLSRLIVGSSLKKPQA